MQKITHNLVQGSDEWMRFRLGMFGASEASAVLGLSKNVRRTELLHMKHTGNPKEFSDWVQKNILDYGHEVEALARPVVEEKYGIDLYPVTCSLGRLSASCDGLTMCEEIAFEHKQWNEELAASVRAGVLPEEHWPQCQQVLMVTGAEKLLFVVSDGTREKMECMEVLPDRVKFSDIEKGWIQFEKDLNVYVPVSHADKPQPTAIMQLPALAVAIRGEVLTSNLPAFTNAAERFLANIKTDLQTDADFADAEETVKFCGRAEKELELAKKSAIAQSSSIDELMRTIDYIKDELLSKRLMLDKLVARKKTEIKDKILSDARVAYMAHVASLEAEIVPVRLDYQPKPDFILATKNKRTLASLHDAVDTELARAKIIVNEYAKDVRKKLAWKEENTFGFAFLFADLQQIITKPIEDFQMLVKNRMEQHQLDEKKKVEQKTSSQPPASPKPAPGKADSEQSIVERTKPILITLARRELDDFRRRYSGIPELVMVMEEIESFMIATAEPETTAA